MINKRICFLQYSLRGGGAERKVCTLANHFVNNGYDVEIGLFGKNIVAYDLDNRVKVIFVDRSSYQYRGWAEKAKYVLSKISSKCFVLAPVLTLEKLAKLIRVGLPYRFSSARVKAHYRKKYDYLQPIRAFILNRPDAVFITMMVQPYTEIMRIIDNDMTAGRINNPFIVMECNNPKPGLDSTVIDDEQRNKYYPRASRVLVMTQEVKAYFSDAIQEKCQVIPNPIRDDLPAPYYGERRKTIVTYCRLNKQKNLPLLLEAFALFHKRFGEYSLEIYGEGEEREALKSLIRAKGLEMAATIHPFDPQVHLKIKKCAMFVSSSDWEGFPNSVLEALALGMPVISTDCDYGPRDMITDHVNGLLVPVGDVQALTDAMAELAEDPELARNLGEKAAGVRDTYAPEIIGRQWMDLIEEVRKEHM